jgi:hypothetical protein
VTGNPFVNRNFGMLQSHYQQLKLKMSAMQLDDLRGFSDR